MQHGLNYEAAKAVMVAIAKYLDADFDQLGITPADFRMTYDEVIWRGEQRIRVIRTLEALLFGTAGMMGIPRGKLPAEFVAGVVTGFVAPCNRRLACYYLEEIGTGGRAEDMAAGLSFEPVGADRLFALVVLLSQEEGATKVRQDFATRLGFTVQQATTKP